MDLGRVDCITHVMSLMIANALNDKPLPVYGTGENVREEQVWAVKRQITVNLISGNLMITLNTILAASIH